MTRLAQQRYQPFADHAGCAGEKNTVRHIHFPSMNALMICSTKEVFKSGAAKCRAARFRPACQVGLATGQSRNLHADRALSEVRCKRDAAEGYADDDRAAVAE